MPYFDPCVSGNLVLLATYFSKTYEKHFLKFKLVSDHSDTAFYLTSDIYFFFASFLVRLWWASSRVFVRSCRDCDRFLWKNASV